ncbi:hypothetical protein L207DRAFT_588295 [Hyaloscypha variabilis F]|uniref:Uncharacterized protein n=1 Tax=Hyaloscypha variabilis (strain UAMH 11265 / GT02V1 / F) TaxID=1149755 RepID=A0A2J6R8F2_HYAVF|nr:hypothetical protein L207DRAFT_588295 [Hyaloscypha variabilis F]
MPLSRRVIEVMEEPSRRRFVLKTPDISVIDFAELLETMSSTIAISPPKETPYRKLREEFKYAQFLMGKGDLERCHQVCIDLINAPKLPVDLKIETIQIMCTLVPLEQARFFLEDALRLASDMVKAEPGNLLWLGLLTTTRDQIWKIYKIKGAIMFHREITFGNPIAAARDRDSKKGRHLVKKQVHLDDRAKAVPNGDPVKRGVQNPGVASQMQPCGFDRRPL